MKKILIIITLTLCIFQMIVLATAIDIGDTASDRGSALGHYTIVNKGNPANATGTVTSIEIWANSALSDCEIATFFVVSGNNLSTRDTVLLGSVASGSKQTFTQDSGSNAIALSVESGDYIGIYYPIGAIENDTSGGDGMWYAAAADKIPCTNYEFNSEPGYVISVYATGISSAEEDNAIFMGANF